jgi:AraC family transcriptional activator of pobA
LSEGDGRGGRLDVDRLAGDAAVEVLLLEDFHVGEGPIRAPHRHEYHEVFWLREGEGRQRIDDEVQDIVAHAVTVIGRGQVHQFEVARGLRGALLRFTDAALLGGEAAGGGRPSGEPVRRAARRAAPPARRVLGRRRAPPDLHHPALARALV